MAHSDESQAARTWVGIWVATKIELASYPSDLSVVRFPHLTIPIIGCNRACAFKSAWDN